MMYSVDLLETRIRCLRRIVRNVSRISSSGPASRFPSSPLLGPAKWVDWEKVLQFHHRRRGRQTLGERVWLGWDPAHPALEQQEALLVPAQQVLNIPLALGISVDLGNVIVTPELGAAWAVHYATAAVDVRDQLESGETSALGLDLWLRVAMEFPLL